MERRRADPEQIEANLKSFDEYLLGANAPEGYFILIGRLATGWYFFHLLILMPVIGLIEPTRAPPESIAAPVLGGGAAPGAATASKMEKS